MVRALMMWITSWMMKKWLGLSTAKIAEMNAELYDLRVERDRLLVRAQGAEALAEQLADDARFKSPTVREIKVGDDAERLRDLLDKSRAAFIEIAGAKSHARAVAPATRMLRELRA